MPVRFSWLLFILVPLIAGAQEDRQVSKDTLYQQIQPILDSYPTYLQRSVLTKLLSQLPKPINPKDTLTWDGKGDFSILLNQAAFNADWSGGGTTNVSGNTIINYDLHYKGERWTWDSKFRGAYGLTKIKDESDVRKTDDFIEINSVLGRNASRYWYYSGYLNFKTQLDNGFRYTPEERIEISDRFSPAFLQVGLGALYKRNNNFRVNLSVATLRAIFVNSRFTEEKAAFGVDQGESSSLEFGASLSGYYKFLIVKNISFEQIFNFYSNYLENPENIDIDYTATLNMDVTKYITSKVIFQTVYDDNTVKAFQVRQLFGLGFNVAL